MAKERKPTKPERAGLAKALLLKKRCEALGVEWDGSLLTDGKWSVDARRYTDLEMKMAEALFNKLGVDLGSSDDAGGQSQFTASVDLAPENDRIAAAICHARDHIAEVLTVERLAEAIGMSLRPVQPR